MSTLSILFVCQANICRSPAAAAILKHLAKSKGVFNKLKIASCAISDDQLGSSPDPRMIKVLDERGIDLVGEAKLFKLAYFNDYDYILAADHLVLNVLRYRARSPESLSKLYLMTDFSPQEKGTDIPDPYRKAGLEGFEEVFDMLISCCEALLTTLFPDHKQSQSTLAAEKPHLH